ncbi:MAG: hypothetical protein K8F91_18870 [Candidatus Obscuribacterales bacterium]|nr:hypothetical protein [Candidatus Obscuribacterales bacterium]
MLKKSTSVALVSGLIILGQLVSIGPCYAKKWTVTERIEKLSLQIEKGRKANELTSKQTAELKKMSLDIQTKMDKMKDKNDGKLGLPDSKKLHRQINDLSVKLLRFRLDNVYS